MKMDKRHSILLVDDEPTVRELIALTLKDSDFDVIEAGNGREAITYLEGEARGVDAIISDLSMPVMGGLGLAKYNYENLNLPFVVCTAISDGRVAINLLKHGVQDFVIKPIERLTFISVVNTAIMRNLMAALKHEGLESLSGNISTISIPATRDQLMLGLDWIRGKTAGVMPMKEHNRFLHYTYEFLINAYEHGSLGIGGELKSILLMEGRYEDEIRTREAACTFPITIDAALLKREVSVRITDRGEGFDFMKYLHMSEDMLIERLEMPNGRGIHMSTNYFDSIEYDRGGASVLLLKKIPS